MHPAKAIRTSLGDRRSYTMSTELCLRGQKQNKLTVKSGHCEVAFGFVDGRSYVMDILDAAESNDDGRYLWTRNEEAFVLYGVWRAVAFT